MRLTQIPLLRIGESDDISKMVPVGISFSNISTLDAGWNIISIPFNEYVNKTDFIIFYDGCYYKLSQASDAQIIDTNVFGWSGGSYFLADVLDPSKGYWLYCYQPCTLKIII